MKLNILPDTAAAARNAASFIAERARQCVQRAGQFTLALSGGQTASSLLAALRAQPMPWSLTCVLQVDERVAPHGHPDRNLTLIESLLLGRSALANERLMAMPVEEQDLQKAAGEYAETLVRVAGSPPRLDLVHLGLGEDGHTASLVPGDPVLQLTDSSVAATGEYHGRRRVTLTLPVLAQAHSIVWFVTGSAKAGALARLARGDPSIPAGRVARDHAVVFADSAAAALLRDVEVRS
jgi:6-phosphogluconolactonase